MTGREFAAHRETLGWTKKRLAEWFDCTAETIRKYEREGVEGAPAIAVAALAGGWRP